LTQKGGEKERERGEPTEGKNDEDRTNVTLEKGMGKEVAWPLKQGMTALPRGIGLPKKRGGELWEKIGQTPRPTLEKIKQKKPQPDKLTGY